MGEVIEEGIERLLVLIVDVIICAFCGYLKHSTMRSHPLVQALVAICGHERPEQGAKPGHQLFNSAPFFA